MAAVDVVALVAVAKAITLVLGGAITLLAYRAFLRTGSRALRSFAIGFGVITLGGLVGGGLDHLAGFDLALGVLVQSALTAIGFAVLAYSLYAYRDRTITVKPPTTPE